MLISDITRTACAERRCARARSGWRKFMQASAEGIVFHKDGFITDVNPPLLALLGLHARRDAGPRDAGLRRARPAAQRVAEVIAARATRSLTKRRCCTATARRIPVEFIVRTMHYQGERLRMTIVRDIRDRLAAQARIHHLAHHDALTGLPNRARLHRAARRRCMAARTARAARRWRCCSSTSTTSSASTIRSATWSGDALLQTVARAHHRHAARRRPRGALRRRRIRACCWPATRRPQAAAARWRDKLLAAIGAPVQVEGVSISVTPSIGVALFPARRRTPAELLIKHADTAMYHAKSRGRAQLPLLRAGDGRGRLRRAGAGEPARAGACSDGEFELHFQPQFALRRRRAASAARRCCAGPTRERGLLGPDAFIPVAEAQRLILPIGQWVLREAVRWAQRWHTLGWAQRAGGGEPVDAAVPGRRTSSKRSSRCWPTRAPAAACSSSS